MFDSKKYQKSKVRSTVPPQYKKEIIGVFIVAVFAFFALSFISYSSSDPSWFYLSSKKLPIANWCGVLGANVAALFFFFLGSASYVFLISLCIAAFLLFRKKPFEKDWFKGERVRFILLPIVVLLSSFFFALHQIDFIAPEPGGLIGRWLHGMSNSVIGKTGSMILLYASFWVSMMLLWQVSFVRFFAAIGQGFFALSTYIGSLFWVVLRGFYRMVRFLLQGVLRLGVFVFSRLKKDDNGLSAEEESGEPIWDDLQDLIHQAEPHVAAATKISFQKGAKYENDRFSLNPSKRKLLLGRSCLRMRNTVINATLLEKLASYKPKKKRGPVIQFHVPDFTQFQEERTAPKNSAEFEERCRERGKKLEEKLLHFGVKGEVVAIRPGPIITLFEYKPEIDSKISKIVSLEDDLAMALTAVSIRIIAPIPGRNVIGFEISNQDRKDVFLADVLKKNLIQKKRFHLPFALGVDITGNPVIQDLVKMPHLLVAGSTGSGKSVGMNTILISLLCSLTPEELKIILIDPKRLEFAPYADVPHLLFPIVTNPRQSIPVLKWVVQEMEDRYDLMAQAGVRNITDYQKKQKGDESLRAMPFIVVMIDELADLMMVAGKDVETQIARVAQMARAAGIHMIVATQRPSVDVVTGIIKVNFPARIAYRVSSKIDSRTIIDAQGAEKLLGRGDMLFLNSGSSVLQRVHGAYVSSVEISRLTDFLRSQEKVQYLDLHEELRSKKSFEKDEFADELYDQICGYVKTIDEISISLLQRKFRIGFNRSARIIEKLELDGVIAPTQGGKMRKVIR